MYGTVASANEEDTSDPSRYITLTIGSTYMTVNGKSQLIDGKGSTPFIEENRTLVPLQAIFEAFSIELHRDNNVITGKHGDVEIKLTIGSAVAYKNSVPIDMGVAPKIVKDCVMIPLRFIAESLGAEVIWIPGTQTIHINHKPLFVELGDVCIYVGDSLSKVESLLGSPNRIDPSHCNFDWHVYNSDYSRFLMVGIRNGYVKALYTNSRGFVTNNAKYGDDYDSIVDKANIELYYESTVGNTVYAVMIVSADTRYRYSFDEKFFRAQEVQNFDIVNAFRVSNGFSVLTVDSVAALTAREHSQDMADKGYFSHRSPNGTTSVSRYYKNGGKHGLIHENIAAGYVLGIDTFDVWANSVDHRNVMLVASHKYAGVGYGYNPDSAFGYYMTQLFCS